MITHSQGQDEVLKSDRREARLLLAAGVFIPAALAAVFTVLIISKQGIEVAMAASALIIVLTWGGVLILPALLRSRTQTSRDL